MNAIHPIRLLCSALLIVFVGTACDETSLPDNVCTQLPGDFDPELGIDVSRMSETASGLCYETLAAGSGGSPDPGDRVGVLNAISISNGSLVTPEEGESFFFSVDDGDAIEGIEEAVAEMSPGARRRLIVPPELAHGDEGADGVPPGAILVVDLELLEVSSICERVNAEFDPSLDIDLADFEETGTGLCQAERLAGSGTAVAQPNDQVLVGYALAVHDGVVFESGEFDLKLGSGQAIAGFDEGVRGMRLGGRRTIIIPPELGYGPGGNLPNIGGDDTLVFELELLELLRCANDTAEFNPSLGIDIFDFTETDSGLCERDDVVGAGLGAMAGDNVTVQFTGWLINGTEFDSGPLTFELSAAAVIPGFDEGVTGMNVGGVRRLIIPSELGYGPEGLLPSIPGNSTLVFEVELLSINAAP